MAGITGSKAVRTTALWTLFLALALAVTLPMLIHPTWWGVHDWPQFFSYYGVPRQAIVEYKELPGWNPYYYGGNIQWGHPDDPTLSPIFIPILIFGEVVGPKIDVILVLAGGMFCMWLLARFLSISAIGSLFASAVWGFNGWHAFHFAVGHMDHMTFLFQPLAVLFYLKALDDRRWAFGVGAVVALMLLSGGPYPFTFTSILLVVLSLFYCARRNNWRPFTTAVLSLVIAAGLSAAKLVSMVEFTILSPPVEPDVSGIGPRAVWRALFDPALGMWEPYAGTKYGAWEFAAFIGYIPAALCIIGVCARIKQVWPWVGVGIVFLIAAFGSTSPVNFFSLFTAPPGLSGMHVPFRFIVHSLLALAIVGAFGLDFIMDIAGRAHLRAAGVIAAALLAAAATGNLIWMHYDRPVALYTLASFVAPHAKLPKPPEAVIRYVPKTYSEAVEVYSAFLDKRRLSWGYDAVHLKEAAIVEGEEGYRGEAYVVDAQAAAGAPAGSKNPLPSAGRAELKEHSLSSYRVSYDATAEADLVLNQNYAPGWAVEGSLEAPENLRGVVAARVGARQGEAVFTYRPMSRVWGGFITLATIAIGAVFVRRGRAGRKTRRSHEGEKHGHRKHPR